MNRQLIPTGPLGSCQRYQTIDMSLIGTLLPCCIVAEATSLSKTEQINNARINFFSSSNALKIFFDKRLFRSH